MDLFTFYFYAFFIQTENKPCQSIYHVTFVNMPNFIRIRSKRLKIWDPKLDNFYKMEGLTSSRQPNDRNMLTQHIATLLSATCCVRLATACCDMLDVVGSSLKMVKFEQTTPNMSQQDGQFGMLR